jgi:hypothetical protein
VEGALVLTRLDASPGRLLLPAAADEQYLVFARPAGTLLAEAWSDPNRQRPLAVPAGRLLVQRRAADSAGALTLSVAAGETVPLVAENFEQRPLGELAAKGGQLRLDPHELSVRPALLVGLEGEWGPALRLGYRYRFDGFGVGLDASLYETERTLTRDRLEERGVQVATAVSWTRELAWLEVSAGVGILGRSLSQTLEALEAERFRRAGVDPVTERQGLAGGGLAEGRATALLGRWRLGLGLTLHALVVSERDGRAPRFDGLGGVEVAANF